MKSLTSKRHGFSLIEIMVVLAIIGLCAMFIYPNIPAVKRKSEDNQMKGKASQFNTAISNFMSDQSVRQGLIEWRGKTNEQRYDLIKKYLAYAPENIEGFITEGYTITFPEDPRSQTGVVIMTPDNEVLQYH